MATMSIPKQMLITIDGNVNITDLTRVIKNLPGVKNIKMANTITKKSRLYDPESGEYLSSETMNTIEDARKGKGIAFSGSVNEFRKWAEEV